MPPWTPPCGGGVPLVVVVCAPGVQAPMDAPMDASMWWWWWFGTEGEPNSQTIVEAGA